jgi:hypothetical protein
MPFTEKVKVECFKLCAVKAINGITGLNCAGTASISDVSYVGLHELKHIGLVIILSVLF